MGGTHLGGDRLPPFGHSVSDERLESSRRHLLSEGWCVLDDVLSADQAQSVRGTLLEAADAYRLGGGSTHMPELDPNDKNLRVFNLLGLNAVFRALILHPLAVDLVQAVLGEHFRISNFTANVARPGSRSMALHSDQAFVAPPPWLVPWSMNIIWCLDDTYETNGATRFIPGSHHYTSFDDVPPDPLSRTRAFEAPRGAIIAMDGRMWHTSGANVTASAERALLFGYYSVDFVRPQVNWNAILPADLQRDLSEELAMRLVLGPDSNVRYAGEVMARNLAGQTTNDR